MRKSDGGDACFISIFIGLLFVAFFAMLFSPREDIAFFENREYAAAPELSLKGIFNDDWESYFTDHAGGRDFLMTLAVDIDMDLLHRPVVNEVIAADDTLLSYHAKETVNVSDVKASAEQMADRLQIVSDTVHSYGGTFLFVAMPAQYDYYRERYPAYLNNRETFTAAVRGTFFPALAERNVSFLDMSVYWSENGITAANGYMSTVDHHFTWKGALSTYQQIIQSLSAESGEELVAHQEEDFIVCEAPEIYLGSLQRKLYAEWNTDEKLVYGRIKEDIPFIRLENGVEVEPSLFDYPDEDSNYITYDFFMAGDMRQTEIKTNRSDLPDVLIYGDSFTNAIETMLYTSFDTMTSMDYRGEQEMSLTDYLLLTKPEMVVCVRDYEVMLDKEGNGNVVEPGFSEYKNSLSQTEE